MKVKISALIYSIIGTIILFSYSSGNALADTVPVQKSSIIGKAEFTIAFSSKKELKSYENRVLNIQSGIENARGSDKKTKENRANKLKSIFHGNKIIGNFPYSKIKIDGVSTTTDDSGKFSFSNITPGTHKIVLYQGNLPYFDESVTIQSGKNKIILNPKTEAKDMAKNMSENMKMDKNMDMKMDKNTDMKMDKNTDMKMDMSSNYIDLSSGINTTNTNTTTTDTNSNQSIMMVASPDSQSGPGTGSSTPYYASGTIIGSGKGAMKILNSNQYVSCNKSSNGTSSDFPNNNSDCAKSIAFGLAYMSNPNAYGKYYDGIYCVDEGMQRYANTYENTGSNVYCDDHPASAGTKPKISYYKGYENKGYNCSSFPFLNHDEKYEPYSNDI